MNGEEEIFHESLFFVKYTEGVKLSGKKTSLGRNSGETIMAPKGQGLRKANLSGKRTELLCECKTRIR